MVGEDDKFGQNTWEEAESTLQKEAFTLAVGKAGLKTEDIRYLFSGDLLGQNIATSFGLMDYQVPLFGLYGACSTCGEALSLGAMCVAAGICRLCCGDDVKPFCQRGKTVPFSTGICQPAPEIGDVDGHGKWRLCAREKRSKARITGITTGKIVDYGIKDSMNMGASMAPAASDVICRHLSDFGRNVTDYDKIITGDLGKVGQEILWDLTRAGGYDISSIHTDCGIEIYDADKQGTGAGGSGCGCAAVTLSAHFMRQIEEGKWKRILFVPTGALLSTVSFNEGMTVPGIAHAVVIEHAG